MNKSNSKDNRKTKEVHYMLKADVKNYSKLDKEEMLEFYKKIYPQIAKNLKKFEDKVRYKKTMGDGFLVHFSTYEEIIEFAFQLRYLFTPERLSAIGFKNPNIKIRIALHEASCIMVDDAIEKREMPIGGGITTIARLEPKVESGKIYCTNTFYDKLKEDRFWVKSEKTITTEEIKNLKLAKDWGSMDVYVLDKLKKNDLKNKPNGEESKKINANETALLSTASIAQKFSKPIDNFKIEEVSIYKVAAKKVVFLFLKEVEEEKRGKDYISNIMEEKGFDIISFEYIEKNSNGWNIILKCSIMKNNRKNNIEQGTDIINILKNIFIKNKNNKFQAIFLNDDISVNPYWASSSYKFYNLLLHNNEEYIKVFFIITKKTIEEPARIPNYLFMFIFKELGLYFATITGKAQDQFVCYEGYDNKEENEVGIFEVVLKKDNHQENILKIEEKINYLLKEAHRPKDEQDYCYDKEELFYKDDYYAIEKYFYSDKNNHS